MAGIPMDKFEGVRKDGDWYILDLDGGYFEAWTEHTIPSRSAEFTFNGQGSNPSFASFAYGFKDDSVTLPVSLQNKVLNYEIDMQIDTAYTVKVYQRNQGTYLRIWAVTDSNSNQSTTTYAHVFGKY